MHVGDKAKVERAYHAPDAGEFVALAGLQAASLEHIPEPLIAALFSYLLGVCLPGPGTNYLKQDMTFLTKACWGESLTASVEVTRLRPEKSLVDLAALCRQGEKIICRGSALVLFRTPAERR